MNVPIVVIAYNRSESLKRLLKSLEAANYDNQEVDLIISIDKSDNVQVYKIAYDFIWIHGEKKIIKQDKNLGLREHVLRSGDIALENDAIIMLEDDLIVSKSFYKYAVQSVKFYSSDKNIGGISLYTYSISEFANLRTFTPMQDDSDVLFMNVPSSWGQIWTNNQWRLFRKWYNNKEYEDINFNGVIPSNALNWGESSWKKYFYMYIAQMKKYIVYPRIGLSTNMGEIGTHNKIPSTEHQSLLMGDFNREFLFKTLSESKCVYDAFLENENISTLMPNLEGKLVVDYYGIKTNFNNIQYLISTKILNFKVINRWSLSLKPYELNIIYDIKGDGLYLYDLTEEKQNYRNIKQNKIKLIEYELPGITKQKALKIVVTGYKEAFIRKIKKILSIVGIKS